VRRRGGDRERRGEDGARGVRARAGGAAGGRGLRPQGRPRDAGRRPRQAPPGHLRQGIEERSSLAAIDGGLGAYADTLSALASGADAETTGALEAAQTGVSGPDWVDVEDGKEKAAREAVTEIVKQLRTNTSGGDLEKAVKDAGPHVRTVCDGLVPYLEAQAQGLADARKEIEKRRTTRNDRRCGTLDNRNVCVAESVIDRTVYANAFGRLAALEASHEDARRAAAGFCAAHRKLVEAAEKGELSDKKTYFDVVDAVKSARAADPQGAADTGKDASKK
jgi:hypothetical protein